jgi:hypothetical protein
MQLRRFHEDTAPVSRYMERNFMNIYWTEVGGKNETHALYLAHSFRLSLMVVGMNKLMGRHLYSPEIGTLVYRTPPNGQILFRPVLIWRVSTTEFVGLYLYNYIFN